MEYNNKHSEKDFEEDVSWIAQRRKRTYCNRVYRKMEEQNNL